MEMGDSVSKFLLDFTDLSFWCCKDCIWWIWSVVREHNACNSLISWTDDAFFSVDAIFSFTSLYIPNDCPVKYSQEEKKYIKRKLASQHLHRDFTCHLTRENAQEDNYQNASADTESNWAYQSGYIDIVWFTVKQDAVDRVGNSYMQMERWRHDVSGFSVATAASAFQIEICF